MDTTILAAIIVAAGAVIAAILTFVLKRNHKQANKKTSSQGTTFVVKENRPGGDLFVSGRDTHVTQQSKDRFMSRESARLVSKVADGMIKDRKIRSSWSAFDVRFLEICFRDTPRGWIFDGAAAKQFQDWEHDQLLNLGVQIYSEVCTRLGYSHPDYKNLALVQEAYVTIRYLLRGLNIVRHPEEEPDTDDFHTLWDGSEPDWCLVRSMKDDGTEEPFSPMIFNRATNAALVIDDLILHRNVIARMKKAGIPVFASLESAVRSKSENSNSRETNEDATAIVSCECGALIVVSGIPIPPPRSLHVRCKQCGAEKDIDSDDFGSLRTD